MRALDTTIQSRSDGGEGDYWGRIQRIAFALQAITAGTVLLLAYMAWNAVAGIFSGAPDAAPAVETMPIDASEIDLATVQADIANLQSIAVVSSDSMSIMPEKLKGMTYRGMDLFAFADFMEIDALDPYTIALFEELCATEMPEM